MKLRDLAALVRGRGLDFGFLVFMAIFVAGIGASTGYTVHVLRQKAIAEHAEIAAMHARAIEDHVTQSFSIVTQTLANLGEAEALPVPRGRRLEAALLTSPALRSVSLLDADNRIVASSNPLNLGVRVDTADYLPRGGDAIGVARIGGPWTGRDFGVGQPPGEAPAAAGGDPAFIPVVQTFRGEKRNFSILAAVNSDYFLNDYGTRLKAEEGFVEILRYDGASLLTTDPRSAGTHGFIAHIADVESGRLEETLADGTSVLTSFRASRSFPLIVAAYVRREHALAGWAAESRRLLVVAVPMLIALTALTTLLFLHLRRAEELKAEARQRELDRLAAAVFRTVDSGVMVTDARDRIMAINPAVTRITGYREEDTLGRKWHVLVAPEHSRAFLDGIAEMLAHAGSWHGEMWHRQRDGQRYMAWQSVNLVRNEGGEVMYKVVAFSDITDRKKAEEAQLRAVIEASPEAVLLVEDDGTISYANRVCERVFGYAAAEFAGLNVDALVPAALRARHREHVAGFATRPHSRPMGSVKLTALRKDRSEFPAEISLSPMTIGGRFVVIASVSDVTERVATERRLTAAKEAAEEALERAHLAERRILDISEETRERIGQELHDDLGQHLTGAAFLSEILFRKLEAVGRTEKDDAAAITRLINDAVAKTRTLAQGLYPVELKEAGLRSMIEQLARNVERTYVAACEVEADEDFGVDDPDVAINLFRMTQEAINNAVRHGKARRIAIALRRSATGLTLEVEDDGCGIGKREAAPDKGGLGMHTMRYRAGLIGASLSIANGERSGARVVIALPLSQEPDTDALQRAT